MRPIEVVDVDEDPVPPRWARVLGLAPSSDDPGTLLNYLYTRQTNLPHGFVVNEVVLGFQSSSWGLGVEAEHVDLSGYKEDAWWRGVTARLGPFALTISRHQSRKEW